MPRKNTYIPLEAFDPRLKDLLTRGALERIELPCTSSEQRTSLRNQLYNYRRRALEAKIPDAEKWYRTKISFGPVAGEGDTRTYLLIIAPRGSEFDDVFSAAKSTSAVHSEGESPSSDPLDALPITKENG